MNINILGISGSLRRQSYNKYLLKAAQQLLPTGADLRIYDLEGLPLFNQDDEKNPAAKVSELKKQIRTADALLIATPEYNYSISGVLKNALDQASRPSGDNSWAGKPAAIIGASAGTFGTARAQYHLRQIFVSLDVLCLNKPEVMITSAQEKFDAEGNLVDEKSKDQLRKCLTQLVEWTERVSKK